MKGFIAICLVCALVMSTVNGQLGMASAGGSGGGNNAMMRALMARRLASGGGGGGLGGLSTMMLLNAGIDTPMELMMCRRFGMAFCMMMFQ